MIGFSGRYYSDEELNGRQYAAEMDAARRKRDTQMCSNTEEMTTTFERRASEQIMVDMIREDLGVTIDPQALRMFLRYRWERIAPLAHRVHDGKR